MSSPPQTDPPQTEGTLFLDSPAQTQRWAERLAHQLFPGAVLLLQGDLGAGKTTLVQGLAQGLGIPDPVTSPTFTLIQEYDQGSLALIHADLYRLTPEQVPDLGLEEMWEEAYAVIVIEWPERLPYWPPAYLHLHLHHGASPESRVVTARACDARHSQVWRASQIGG
ncbi:MAG: hypothetical protein OHK0012_01360 [Synechococcales cyanobacterium]